MTVTIFPRFLGVDDGGDFVWELENGRWTFGDDPYAAATKQRTFEPARYAEKYGAPVASGPFTGRTEKPARPAGIDTGGPLGSAGERGAYRSLKRLLDVLDGWVEGARSNHDALDHRGEMNPCWETFHVEDIRNMVNDAAREVGVAEPWSKESKA